MNVHGRNRPPGAVTSAARTQGASLRPPLAGQGNYAQIKGAYERAALDVIFHGIETPSPQNANQFNQKFSVLLEQHKRLRDIGRATGDNVFSDVQGIRGRQFSQSDANLIADLIAGNVRSNKYQGYNAHAISFLLAAYRNEFYQQGYTDIALRIHDALTDLNTPRHVGVGGRPLGKGAFNEVMLVQTPNGPKVFKPHNPNAGRYQSAGYNMGIDRDNPRSEVRNVLTGSIARRLGFDDCVVGSRFANINGRKGILMDVAPGTSQSVSHTYTYRFKQPLRGGEKRVWDLLNRNADKKFYDNEGHLNRTGQAEICRLLGVNRVHLTYDRTGKITDFKVTRSFRIPEDIRNRQFQRQTVELGLLDWITGQTDRHAGNIIGGKGIDNDACWGSVPLDLRLLNNSHNKELSFRNVRPPLVVDHQMMESIWRLNHRKDGRGGWIRDDNMYRAQLAGHLNDSEIEAAVERLHQVQEHLSSSKVRKINAREWGSKTVTDLLLKNEVDADGKEIATSYLGREYHGLAGRERISVRQFEAFKRAHPA